MVTVKPATTLLTIITIIALITKVNRPKVSIFIGNVKIRRMGFKTALAKPSSTETNKATR